MRSPLNRSILLSPEERAVEVQPIRSSIDLSYSTIYQGDVVAALAALPDSSFNLIVADPPYNYGNDFGNNSDRQSRDAYVAWFRMWIQAMVRVAKPNASFYICCGWEYSGLYQQALSDAGLTILNRITWKREKGRGAKTNWKQNMEDIWYAVRDPNDYRFNLNDVKLRKKVIATYRENGKPKDWETDESGESFRMTHPSNIWIDLTVPFWSMPENTPHPTQKPESLVERIILASSKPGDRVLDLFSGSGTTSVVAKKLSREFLGFELNPEYIRYGLKRLSMVNVEIPI